jgi:hypothetical protein
MRRFVLPITMILSLTILLALTGCGKKQAEEQQQQQAMQQNMPPQQEIHQGPANSAAGIHWTVPSAWQEQAQRSMRIATYGIPAVGGQGDGGECAVFFFGRGEGGDVEANINRWISQFEKPGDAQRSTRTVDGMPVTLVRIAGTYLAPSGPMMQSSGKKDNYKLLGAIISAPEGSVFFKFTGPAKVVDASENDFNALINSIAKVQKVS